MIFKNCLFFFIFHLIILFNLKAINPISGQNYEIGKIISEDQREIKSFPQPDTSGIDIHYLRLDINANDTNTNIQAVAYYLARVTVNVLSEIIFDFSHNLAVDSLFVDGAKENYQQNYDLLKIQLSSNYQLNQELGVKIYYHGSAASSGFFSGLSNGPDPATNQRVTWTLSEPFGAKDWFPAKQVLTDKIDSVDMNITTPANCLAGSNGNLIEISTLPDGSKCHHWKSRYPIDYYLISFTVSNYQEYRVYAHPKGSKDSLLVQNYIYNIPGYLQTNKPAIDETVKFIELFANLFGPYPFDKEKYGHCLAPIGGGMEHQTMTTISNFDFGLIAHELCHMWFGDHVTCASWQDIWLNESFASYGEYLAHWYIEGSASGLTWIKHAHDEAMLYTNGSVCVPIDQISNESRIFSDPLSYKKGASVLHMLRYELNDDSLFFYVLREYGRSYAYGTATTENFRKVLEDITGKDYQWFFDQWYYGEGYPIINVSWTQKSKSVTVNTEQSPSASTPLFKTSMDLQLIYEGGDTIIRIWMDDLKNHFELPTDKLITSIVADPNSWLLKRTTVLQLPDITDFKIGPNPFSSGPLVVNFYTGSIYRTFHITDINGKLISEFTSADKNVSISSTILCQGIYILNITEGEKNWQIKIVKD